MNKKIILNYMNNVCRKQIGKFEINIENENLLNQFISQIKNILKDELIHTFDNKNLYIVSDKKLVEFSHEKILTELTEKDEVLIYYSEVFPPENAAIIDLLELKNGLIIKFSMFSREQNHRNKPHVQAEYKGNEINISISDSPKILAGEFKGNNHCKYEKKAIEHVKCKKDFFMQKWEEFVESQF